MKVHHLGVNFADVTVTATSAVPPVRMGIDKDRWRATPQTQATIKGLWETSSLPSYDSYVKAIVGTISVHIYIYTYINVFHHLEVEVGCYCQHMYYITTVELYRCGKQMNGVYCT